MQYFDCSKCVESMIVDGKHVPGNGVCYYCQQEQEYCEKETRNETETKSN